MPKKENEIIVYGSKDNYYLGTMAEDILEKNLHIQEKYSIKGEEEYELKIVGIKYIETSGFYTGKVEIYVDNTIIEEVSNNINSQYITAKMLYQNKYYKVAPMIDNNSGEFTIESNDKVSQGKAYVYNYFNGYTSEENYIGNTFDIEVSNINYEDKITFTIDKIYNSNNIESLLGKSSENVDTKTIYISTNDYNKLFNKQSYQSSVYVKEVQQIQETVDKLHDMGYSTLCIKDTLINSSIVQILQIFRTIVTLVLVIGLFFITYFIIRIILKSRNIYFSTIRMLGASKQVARNLLIIELLAVTNIAYFTIIIFINLVKTNIIENQYILNLSRYVHFQDYTILYFILIAMSYLVSLKFAKKLFKKSTMSTFKEEV